MADPHTPPPAHWARIDTIFTRALDVDPERWPAFLEEVCGGDVEVRTRVMELLRRSQTVKDRLQNPCLEVQPELPHGPGRRDAPFPTEARIGPYRIIDTLGRGGAGTVYLAERAEGAQKPPVALKVLRRGLDTDDLLERFTVERQILATLDHPDVARLLDAGATEDGRPYLVMEHVDGEPITEHCRARHLSVEERLGLFVRVARAVHHAHGSLVVHRDLKPTNVLVAEDGTPKLLDFGIAKLLNPDALAGKGPRTRTGTRLLTPGYASPEQRRGEPVTPASDIYQLGLLLWELLTGVAAYEAADREREEAGEGPLLRIPAPSKVVRRTGDTGPDKETGVRTGPVREAPPDTGSTTQRRRRWDLDRIVMTALEEDPGDRYRTAAALAADVERVLQGQRPRGVAHLPTGLTARKLARRLGSQRRRVAVAALALGTMAGILAVASVTSRGPGDGEPPIADPGDPSFDLVPPPWVVVAEFNAPADEPELGWAVRELVLEALDQTVGVAPLPLAEFEAALRAAGLPDTARVHPALARELSVRAGASMALAGSVFRLGSGYGIRVNALDSEDGRVLVSVLERSPDQAGLMAGVERLANRLVSALAGASGAVPRVRLAMLLTTSSWEAHEEYLRYLRASLAGTPTAASRAALHRALDLDPEFAMAWRALAEEAWRGYRPDSARVAMARALELGDPVTQGERLHIAATEAMVAGNDETEIELYGRILGMNPHDVSALNNRAIALSRLGRYEDALGHLDALQALLPEREATRTVARRFRMLLSLGRFEDARHLRSQVAEQTWREGEMLMALASGEWAVAESLSLALLHDPDGLGQRVAGGRWTMASAQGARGALRAADSTLLALPWWDNGRARLVLALSSGCDLAAGRPPPAPERATSHRLWWNAAVARMVGPPGLASGWISAANQGVHDPSGPAHLRTLYAALDHALEGRWSSVTSVAGQQARQGVHDDYGTTALRWLVADAYERLGRPDSAAVYFHMVADPLRAWWREDFLRGFAYPFAHRRLAFLYSGLGDAGRAEHHWNVFRSTFTNPDPELLWLLEKSPLAPSAAQENTGAVPAGAPLFHDADRACASIEAGRLASFERALSSTAAWLEAYFAEHGRYPDASLASLSWEAGRQGELLVLRESHQAAWTATALDLRDARTCHLSGGQASDHQGREVVCLQRTPTEAHREDGAVLQIGWVLGRMAGAHLVAARTDNLFPPELVLRDGELVRARPGDRRRWLEYPEVWIDITAVDARELRAAVTHPDTPVRCTLRLTDDLQAFLGCSPAGSTVQRSR